MENIIWSSNITKDKLLNSSKEEKLTKLIELGYDPEMLMDADLDDVIASDDTTSDKDLEEFDDVIAPEIENQTYNGIVLLVDADGSGFASYARDIIDISSDIESYTLVEDDNGLALITKAKDSHRHDLYAIPEDPDKLKDFIEVCLSYKLTEVQSMYDELDYLEAIEKVKDEVLDDPMWIDNYCDFSAVADVCDRITMKNSLVTESVNLNEVKAKDPETLAKEYEEIKALSNEYGKEYFTSMPFSAFEDDPITIEAQYPNFAKVVKAFFKEMLDEDPNDPEAMDFQWDSGIDDHDWDILMTLCEKLVTKNQKGEYPNMQIEKVFKNGFDDGLSEN